MKQVHGRIQRGHQVASGLASTSPYPQGTIAMQMPIFQQLGLDIIGCFPGTINVYIAPLFPSLSALLIYNSRTNKLDNSCQSCLSFQISKNKRFAPAHFLGIPFHDAQICSHIRC